jgi:hypothetical protein
MSDVAPGTLPAFHSSQEILTHPRFLFARDEFVKSILALYEHKPFLNRLLLEASRAVLPAVIMCLYARHDEADRATWPRCGSSRTPWRPIVSPVQAASRTWSRVSSRQDTSNSA